MVYEKGFHAGVRASATGHQPILIEIGKILGYRGFQKMIYSLKYFGSLYNALEIKSRFALTLHYKRLSSRNTEEFSLQFQKLYPGEIHAWQTDNGAENLGDFHRYLKKYGILDVFSYPRCPKINAYPMKNFLT